MTKTQKPIYQEQIETYVYVNQYFPLETPVPIEYFRDP